MAIYSELLEAVMDSEGDSESLTTGELLALLIESRSCLDAGTDGGAADAVARELSYDLALVRLCRHLGIKEVTARYDQPLHERKHLEEQLCAAGLDLSRLDELWPK